MPYLQPAEYTAYGLPEDTAAAWITTASAMIDAHCRRPSLLSTSYTERLRLGERSQSTLLSYSPVLSVDTVKARYARPRGLDPDTAFSFAGIISTAFNLPGAWVSIDPGTLCVSHTTGELEFPQHTLGFRYSEAEVTYTAGLSTVPDAVKVACAQIVRNAQATPGLNVKSSRVDTLVTEYFSDSLLDSQVQALLQPFVAERLG